jgi:hypothetical protein
VIKAVSGNPLRRRYKQMAMLSPSVTRQDVTLFGMTALRASAARLWNGCGSLSRPRLRPWPSPRVHYTRLIRHVQSLECGVDIGRDT